ncbi:Chromodomain-helicase-DNA-binding protein 4 [Vanrija pseudolonga]|uniref:Chromodomain-helicase-DNA-binding protein 4 n=1 Tax=Vanrija pseudolonga TaxID=143232 RepID=A0AAF0Y1H2_9TREE|nr:Chromodomain-helicase-DNA-binding protein 4 [Vanrija pseudolonga]
MLAEGVRSLIHQSPIRDDSESEASDDPRARKRARESKKTRTAAAPAKKPKPKAKVPQTHRELSSASTASYHPTQKEWESEGENELDNEDDIYELESSSDDSPKASPLPTSRKILARHRQVCERCHNGPADELLEKALKKKKKGMAPRRRKDDDDDWDMSEEERARIMMGWLECERCTVSWHWGCLKPNQRKDILHAFRTKNPDAPRRRNIEIHESATFLCESCETTPECFVCHHSRLPEEKAQKPHPLANGTTSTMANGGGTDEPIVIDSDDDAGGGNSAPPPPSTPDEPPKPVNAGPVEDPFRPDGLRHSKPAPLIFRCFRCKLGVHYEHLKSPFPDGDKFALPSLAHVYQTTSAQGSAWYCHQCREWNYKVESIIAWRPWPANATEPELEEDEVPLYRDPLPREYLVKFEGRSFRHVVWAPHPWVYKVSPPKLKNFVEKGPALNLITDETLATFGDTMEAPTIANVLEASERDKKHHGVPPDPEAAESLPIAWSTVDRVIDAMLLPPKKRKGKGKAKSNGRVIESDSESEESDWEPVNGKEPPIEKAVEIERWESMAGRKLSEDDVDEVATLVTWFLAKWDDLQYDQSCWDTPPPVDSELYPAFKHALKRYLAARRVKIPVLNDKQIKARERLARTSRAPPNEQPECVVGGTLMPFQIEGFQWLTYKHLKRESCILADDMGLGKTIQVASFLGHLGSEDFGIYPALVIVPNSTITNWVREFEKWVPHLRVVPYYGVASSRKVVSKFELYHKGAQNKAAGLKAHVVLTTYDMITSSEFAVFSRMPRWEVVIVDEGQRLKSNSSLIFNRLKTLNSVHRILLTGTPLNNNLREIFNLLNFLDPESFRYLEELEERFENLTESLILELHEMIKPYILRRVKADVLKLPPKVEIIVPISLTPAQKVLNKRILHRHKEAINNIMKQRKKKKAQAAKAKGKGKEVANGDALPNGTAAVNGTKEGDDGEGGKDGEGSKDGGAAPNGDNEGGEAGPSQTAPERRTRDSVQPSEVIEVD